MTTKLSGMAAILRDRAALDYPIYTSAEPEPQGTKQLMETTTQSVIIANEDNAQTSFDRLTVAEIMSELHGLHGNLQHAATVHSDNVDKDPDDVTRGIDYGLANGYGTASRHLQSLIERLERRDPYRTAELDLGLSGNMALANAINDRRPFSYLGNGYPQSAGQQPSKTGDVPESDWDYLERGSPYDVQGELANAAKEEVEAERLANDTRNREDSLAQDRADRSEFNGANW